MSSNSCQVQAFQDDLWANFWPFSNWFEFLLLELMFIQARAWNFVQLLHFLVCWFTVSLNALVSMSLHVGRPRYCLCLSLSHPSNFSVAPAENTWFKHLLILFDNCFIRFALTLSTSQVFMVKKWCGFANVHIVHQLLPHGAIFCFFPTIFMMSSTYTDKNDPCIWWTNRHSQFGTFSHPSTNRPPSNRLSHKRPASGCPYRFRSRGTTEIFNGWQWFRPFVSWKTYRYVCTVWLWNFEQSGSVLQFYLSAGRYCISCLSVTTW